MQRRSKRLRASGYYDSDGNPIISYKERLHKVFKRRFLSVCGWNASDLDMDQSTARTVSPYFLFLMLPLCFGLLCYITALNIDSLFPRLLESALSPDDEKTNTKTLSHVTEQKEVQTEAKKLPNIALASLGARIVFHQTSKSYQTPDAPLTLFGVPIRHTEPERAYIVIQGQTPLPGRCWAFPGSRGQLVIALSYPVGISHVTVSHISKTESPTGKITSAPKHFSVYGKEDIDSEETGLGGFCYDQDGQPEQTFEILKKAVFNFVKLEVHSNWGHPNYTCIYSFKVHGRWQNAGDEEGDNEWGLVLI